MQLTIKSSIAMRKLGTVVAGICKPGCVIYLSGELGVGKTTFARGFLRGLKINDHVRSPTFTLFEQYQIGDKLIYHFDLYRLIDAEEFMYIGARDFFTDKTICLIEWPQHGTGFLPKADLICDFYFITKRNERKATLIANSSKGKDIIKNLKTKLQ